MTIIGKLLKAGIDLSQKFTFDSGTYRDKQTKELHSLMEEAKDTAFGKYYGFSKLLENDELISEFKKTVPIFTYEKMQEHWWRQQQQFPDISWPGRPRFFALSSGTTGKESKRIPITNEFLDSMKRVGRSMIASLPHFDLPEELFESEILMLSSSANLQKNDKGFSEGEISGINVSNFPGWYEVFYRPGNEIAAISDWDERVARIAEEAPKWNIGAIAGIPSWILLMLRKVIEVNHLETIHDIWPNLTVYASGGVAYETYRKDFDAICRKPLIIMDTYLASEGFIAFNSRPETMAMELALEHGYFYEFIPFDERGVDEMGNVLENPVSLQIDEVKVGEEYVLILSSCAGAWRYQIGDVIKFESLDPPQIKITGRTKFFLNVVGSQLSEEKMDAAILEISEKHNVSINEYMVAAVK
ncbi:MAG TPA: GH3 auxin-responsive promoter family protein, partial [Cryomorphaceae bacterium]|nr:GH3 auxin-responsive promoter family protein [Cryomorphaceae bacterium]